MDDLQRAVEAVIRRHTSPTPGTIGELIARYPELKFLEATAAKLVARFPELQLLEAIPGELARLAAERELLSEHLATQAQLRHLPPPGTTVAQAFRQEVGRLREQLLTRQPLGGLAQGIDSGRRAVLRALEARADALEAADPGPARPQPAPAGHGSESAVQQAVRWHLSDPQRFLVEQRIREATPWLTLSGGWADLSALLRSELSTLADLAADLQAAEAQTRSLRDRAAAAGLSDAGLAWRAALAAELRHQADEVTVRPIISDDFGAGYQLAAASLSTWLRGRAAELAP